LIVIEKCKKNKKKRKKIFAAHYPDMASSLPNKPCIYALK
jgi:thymidylate synthase